jgi:PAS domain S-box-containing protein
MQESSSSDRPSSPHDSGRTSSFDIHNEATSENGTLPPTLPADGLEAFSLRSIEWAPVPMTASDIARGIILNVNPAFTEFMGFDRDALLGHSAGEFRADSDDRPCEVLQILSEEDRVRDFEIQVRDGSGDLRWMVINARRMSLDGNPVAVCSWTDITARKSIEETLRSSEERFRTSLENMLDGFAILKAVRDETGRIVDFEYQYINEAGCRDNRGKREDFIGRRLLECWPAHRNTTLFEEYCHVVESGNPLAKDALTYEDFWAGKREHRVFEVHAAKLDDGLALTWRDITERKRVQEALRLTQYSVDLSADAVLWLRPDGSYTYANEAACKMLGYTRDELLTMGAYDVAPEHPREKWNPHWKELERRKALSFETVFRTKDGRLIPVEITANYVAFEGQAYNCAFVRDITERKRAEESVRESEEKFRGIAEQVGDVLFLNDTSGIITYVSPAANRVFGADPEKMIGKQFMQFLADKEIEKAVSSFRKNLAERTGTVGLNLIMKRFDGSLFHGEVDASVFYHDGQIAGTLGVIRDVSERVEAEQALRNSEHLLRESQAVAGIGSYVTDLVAGYWSSSPELDRIFGINEAFDRSVEGWLSLIHPDSQDKLRCYLEEEVLAGRKRFDTEYKIVRHCDGAERWVHGLGELEFDEAGHPIKMIGTIQDITERKQAEIELAESRESYRELIENLNDIIYAVDKHGLITYISPVARNILGYDPAELIGKPYSVMVHPDDLRSIHEPFRNILDNRAQPSEHRFVTKNGQIRRVSTSSRPIFSGSEVVGLRGVLADVTDRKQAEEALRRLQKAVETSGEVIFITDIQGTFMYVNPAFTKLYGYAPEDVIGKATPRILRSSQTNSATQKQIWNTILAKEIFRGELVNRNTLGGDVYVEVSINPVLDDRGELEGFLAVQRDIADRKHAEEQRERLESQLRQAQKLETIGTLAGGIAHDFINILVPIIVYSDMAVRSLEAGHPLREDLLEVIKSANRARDLVKQILTFSRQTEQECFPIEPAPIIKEALKLLRASIPATIVIVPDIDVDSGTVIADPSQIHQVLMNLCTNAYHAMRDTGGVLNVRLKQVSVGNGDVPLHHNLPAGDYVRLSVSDTGCGMDQQTIDRIFEPFFTTKQVGEGTGLGLSVVHGIITRYGGVILVHSEPGKGSTFDVYFPRTHSGAMPLVSGEASVVGGRERVLVVDDDPAVAETTKIVLEQFGYAVTVRSGGQEALELFRKDPRRFDLVLSDQTMPYMTGDHLARELIRIRIDIPIILMTGYSETVDERKCTQLGIDRLLMKPVGPNDLARAVRDVLDRATAS